MKTFLTVKLALIPFAVFWALLALGAPAWAIFSAFTLSLAGNLWRFWRGEVFALEIGGTLLFAGFGAAWIAAPLWAAANCLWLSFAALGLVSFMSLGLRHPWTADYARAAYPDNATSPQFFVINAAMTALWGALFLVLGTCRYFGAPTVVTAAVAITGALISILGPRLAIRFALQRLQAGRETYHWPAPSFTRDADVDVDVAVIGAGIGGLSAAALLADAGLRVAVLDHHVLAGGYCHTYLRKAHWHGEPVLYRFDAGPHDFSGVWPGGPVTGLLERLGVADRIAWRRVDHTYRLGGAVIDVPRDWREYARLLGESYPQSAAGIGALFEEIHAIFEDMYATG
ncbi:putative thiazole biosynthetic enzyme [mine drainage metagenome]|uniref:Putative thiazole biosynthetic enzyme n=1 Tax=mine drainage metagenome TaxID=410659 RepID=A0A1J5PZG2_9ZZZZ